MRVVLPLLVSIVGLPVTAIAGSLRPGWAAVGAAVTCLSSFAALLLAFAGGVGSVAVPWVPAWNIGLSLRLDEVGALYGLLTTGIGALVALYAVPYIRRHLHHEHRPAGEEVRFHLLFLLFMASMLGLVLADDLVLLFVFWDLTAVASFFLIGFDREKEEARRAAVTALVVTGGASVLMLVGFLAVGAGAGTFRISALPPRIEELELSIPMALVAVAALAKSAQMPLHFWLPPAMTAPTPVSAYLHSAAMVAAGVFLIERLHPLFAAVPWLLAALAVLGAISTVVGGLLALLQREMKKLLAYSTIAQYGQILFLLGLGTPAAVGAASFYVIAHAVPKSALFLAAGVATEATGAKDFANVSGLLWRMPLMAVATGVAAAGLAGLPLTIGFFKDEMLFKAALEHGPWVAGAAGTAAGLTLAYMWRFWSGMFLGPPPVSLRPLPALLSVPVVVLAALILAWGVSPKRVADVATSAAAALTGAAPHLDPAYHLALTGENALALAAYAAGAILVLFSRRVRRASSGLAWAGDRIGPAAATHGTVRILTRTSVALQRIDPGHLPARIALVAAGAAAVAGLAQLPFAPAEYRVDALSVERLPLVAALAATATSAIAAARARHPVVVVLALTFPSLFMAAAFAVMGAPDVALVAVLIGIGTIVLFVVVFVFLPARAFRPNPKHAASRAWRGFQATTALFAGAGAFLVLWGVFSSRPLGPVVATAHLELAPAAHARNVVNAVLVDFRGLDTAGEITVIVIALIGIAAFLRRP